MRSSLRTLLVFLLAATAFTLDPAPCGPAASIARAATDDAVVTWNANAGAAATAACIAPLDNPLHESRMYGMMHIAIHDACSMRSSGDPGRTCSMSERYQVLRLTPRSRLRPRPS